MRIIGLFFIWEMLNIPAGRKQDLGSVLQSHRYETKATELARRTHTHTLPTCVLFLLPAHSSADDLQQLLLRRA